MLRVNIVIKDEEEISIIDALEAVSNFMLDGTDYVLVNNQELEVTVNDTETRYVVKVVR